MRTFQSLRSRYLKAFTLIELLVVISIIALLISILLPALGKARAAAIQTQTKSDYAGLMKMVHIYATDNNNYGPTTSANGEQTEFAPLGYSGSGVGQMSRWHTNSAITTWMIWDSRINASSLFGAGVGLRVGLGTFVGNDYSSDDMRPFFHPQMRIQTQSDATGGARRHWYHAGVSKDWGKTSNDVCGLGNTVWSPQSNNVPANASNNGTLINTTVAYRGGYFGTFGGASDAFNGTKEQIRFSNKRTDAVGYTRKPQLMSVLFENQIRRAFGEVLYSLGDASVGADKNVNFMNTGTWTEFNTAGTNPAWLAPVTTNSNYYLDNNDNFVSSGSSSLSYSNGIRGSFWFYKLDTILGVPGQ